MLSSKKFSFILLLTALLTVYSNAYENRLSLGAGVFYPNSEDLDGWKDGTNITFGYTRKLSKKFYLQFDLSGHSTDTEIYETGFAGDGKIKTKSIEVLGVFSHQVEKVELYIGIGVGIYKNEITLNLTDGYYKYRFKDDGRGTGGLVKVGIRYTPSESAFIGVFLKAFTNNQDIRFYYIDSYGHIDSLEESYDFGGTVVNLEAGITF